MRVLLSTFGSRGDFQPLVALAVQLKALGADAVVCAPPDDEFATLLADHGVALAPAFEPVRKWIAEQAAGSARNTPSLAAEIVVRQHRAIIAAARPGCDAIVATGLIASMGAANCVAETLGVAFFHMSVCPVLLPSPHFPSTADDASEVESYLNRRLREMNNESLKAVKTFRASLGLPDLASIPDHLFTDRPMLAADPVIAPWPTPSDLQVQQSGAWLLEDTRPLPEGLIHFLEAGEAPIYIGFGSLPTQDPEAVARLTIEAVRAHGHRVIVASGWAGLALIDNQPDAFAVGEINQQALFPRLAAIIHHGGAGTTTAAAKAGIPQVIVPQMVDQPYWAHRISAMGIGAAHDGPMPTAETLNAALSLALSPEIKARAEVVAPQIVDGAPEAARFLIKAIAESQRP